MTKYNTIWHNGTRQDSTTQRGMTEYKIAQDDTTILHNVWWCGTKSCILKIIRPSNFHDDTRQLQSFINTERDYRIHYNQSWVSNLSTVLKSVKYLKLVLMSDQICSVIPFILWLHRFWFKSTFCHCPLTHALHHWIYLDIQRSCVRTQISESVGPDIKWILLCQLLSTKAV